MLLFVIKRLIYILIAIPIVVFLGFKLFSLSPIDPVARLISVGEYELEKTKQRVVYIKTARNYKLDLPPFYFAINKQNYHKDFYSIIYPDEKQFFRRFLDANYSYHKIRILYDEILALKTKQINANKNDISFLNNFESLTIDEFHQEIQNLHHNNPELFANNSLNYKELQNSQKNSYNLIPKFMWLGMNNQYHIQLKQVFTGNIPSSMRDGRSVYTKLSHAFGLTLFMIIMSLIISLLPGIYIGKKMALYDDSQKWKWLETVLFLLRSIPLFWFLTICLMLFTTPEYSKYFYIFPSVNAIGFSGQESFITNILRNGSQLILPVLGVAIFNLGYISRQVKTLLKREMKSPYLITAKMKGLNKIQIQQHAYKNARPQIITMVSSGIASAIGGSVVVEFIFNIPGMGRLLLDSIRYSDFPMLLALIVFLFILTSIIFMVADILYVKSDPRLVTQYE